MYHHYFLPVIMEYLFIPSCLVFFFIEVALYWAEQRCFFCLISGSKEVFVLQTCSLKFSNWLFSVFSGCLGFIQFFSAALLLMVKLSWNWVVCSGMHYFSWKLCTKFHLYQNKHVSNPNFYNQFPVASQMQ